MVRTDPDWVATWSDEEVARRWLRLFPGAGGAASSGPSSEEAVQSLLANPKRIGLLRERLGDIGWLMRCLKAPPRRGFGPGEPIARWANREDGVTGRFWEGRFKCHRLLDARAVLACCPVGMDLN